MLITVNVQWIFLWFIDIDECTTGVDECDQNCQNNIGSYECSCDSGYILNDDGFRCNGMNKNTYMQ